MVIIGTFFKTLKKAEKAAEYKRKLWRRKIDWFVIQVSGGWMVISEQTAKAVFPILE